MSARRFDRAQDAGEGLQVLECPHGNDDIALLKDCVNWKVPSAAIGPLNEKALPTAESGLLVHGTSMSP